MAMSKSQITDLIGKAISHHSDMRLLKVEIEGLGTPAPEIIVTTRDYQKSLQKFSVTIEEIADDTMQPEEPGKPAPVEEPIPETNPDGNQFSDLPMGDRTEEPPPEPATESVTAGPEETEEEDEDDEDEEDNDAEEEAAAEDEAEDLDEDEDEDEDDEDEDEDDEEEAEE